MIGMSRQGTDPSQRIWSDSYPTPPISPTLYFRPLHASMGLVTYISKYRGCGPVSAGRPLKNRYIAFAMSPSRICADMLADIGEGMP